MMKIKQTPNHKEYLIALSKMSAEQRLIKTLELSDFTKELFMTGLRNRFPKKTSIEIKEIYLQGLVKCYNQNY